MTKENYVEEKVILDIIQEEISGYDKQINDIQDRRKHTKVVNKLDLSKLSHISAKRNAIIELKTKIALKAFKSNKN